MVPITRDIAINLNKLLKYVVPKRDKYINEKIIFYLRLYTDLIKAELRMKPDSWNSMVNLLKVVRNMASSCEFKEEEAYVKRIKSIASEILSKINKIKIKVAKDPSADAYHAKTKLQLAQNICILRILRRGAR